MKQSAPQDRATPAMTLSERKIYLFSAGEFGSNLFATMRLLYMLYFLTDVMKLPTGLAASISVATQVADFFILPLAGAIADGTQPRWGKYRSWLLLAPWVQYAAYVLLFTRLDMAPTLYAVFYVALYVVLFLAYNLICICYRALVSVIGRTAGDRIALAAAFAQVGAVSRIVFSLAGATLLAQLAAKNEARGFVLLTLIFGALLVACYLISFRSCRDSMPQEMMARHKQKHNLTVAQMLAQLQTRAMITYNLANMGAISASMTVSSLLVYYFKYVLENPEMMGVYLGVAYGLQFVITLFVRPVARRVGKRKLYLLCVLLALVSLALIRFSHSFVSFTLYMCGINGGLCCLAALLPAMTSDVVDYNIAATGLDARGFIYSVAELPIKVGGVAAAAISGFGLRALNFSEGAAPAGFATGLLNLFSILPGLLLVLAAVMILLYDAEPQSRPCAE